MVNLYYKYNFLCENINKIFFIETKWNKKKEFKKIAIYDIIYIEFYFFKSKIMFKSIV